MENILATLRTIFMFVCSLAIVSPLEKAKAEKEAKEAAFSKAVEAENKAAKEAEKALQALFNNPNKEAAKKAENAKKEAENKAKEAVEAAQKADEAEKAYKTLQATEKEAVITGADKVQMACFIAAFKNTSYEQKELVEIALEATKKAGIGQYGYFKRIARLAKLMGIEITIKLPEKKNN